MGSNDDFDGIVAGLVGLSRRQVLFRAAHMSVLGLTGSLLAACGKDGKQAPPKPAPSTTPPTAAPSPTPASGCETPSRCGANVACGESDSCKCIESAEGDIVCGAIPKCNSPLCTTSADCAYLGPGYFCDTPNSGCCTEPPAEKTRCIAPCLPPTWPTPNAQPSQIVVCDPRYSAPGEMTDAGCAAASLEDRGAVVASVVNENPVRRLMSSLVNLGFSESKGPEYAEVLKAGRVSKFAVIWSLTKPASNLDAVLVMTRSPGLVGRTTYFAVVTDTLGRPQYGLTVDYHTEVLTKVLPDDYTPVPPAEPIPFRGNSSIIPIPLARPGTEIQAAMDPCVMGGMFFCTGVVGLGCAGASALVCGSAGFPTGGIGSVVCAMSAFAICNLGVIACRVAWEETFCKAPKAYCACDGGCYTDAVSCLQNCRAGLGCLGTICGPPPPGKCGVPA